MIHIPIPESRLAAFCRKWQVAELSLFGSVLREDFRPDSDVDVLVSFAPGENWSLFDLMDMKTELSALLGREVDLMERRTVERSPNYIRRRDILEHAERVYAR